MLARYGFELSRCQCTQVRHRYLSTSPSRDCRFGRIDRARVFYFSFCLKSAQFLRKQSQCTCNLNFPRRKLLTAIAVTLSLNLLFLLWKSAITGQTSRRKVCCNSPYLQGISGKRADGHLEFTRFGSIAFRNYGLIQLPKLRVFSKFPNSSVSHDRVTQPSAAVSFICCLLKVGRTNLGANTCPLFFAATEYWIPEKECLRSG
jgi:hypothetical protein